MGCKYASVTDEYYGWECSVAGGACMFLPPNSKLCAEKYGEGPDVEKLDFEKIVEKMVSFICDNICEKLKNKTEDEATDICSECELGEHICNLLNQYEKINDFDKISAEGAMKKYRTIVMCNECIYYKNNEKKRCEKVLGLRQATEEDGCSRGKKK